MQNRRYPKLNIRSKNELAKHISSDGRLSFDDALALINDVIKNYDSYWSDYVEKSKPEDNKWVRNAAGTNLGKLLKRVDARLLKANDGMLPNFIFGGVTGLNHKAAVKHLLGTRRNRMLLKLDVSRFFEQVHYERVYYFFLKKCGCSDKAARLLAELCCVPFGAKNQPGNYKTIARGFSTSPRLAAWCNLDTFLKIDRLIKKELKGKDARLAIYVDDIGITASNITKEDLMRIYPKIKAILEDGDKNQRLPLNDKKSRIVEHTGKTYSMTGELVGSWGFEHLGIQMNRNSLTLGWKTRWKLSDLTRKLKQSHGKNKKIKASRKSTSRYKNYIES